MNRDSHLIYEGYRQKRHLTPKESLQRDKEFFNYVIESNSHLSSLKKFSTKKLFSSYVSTLANRIDSDNPGLIKESNMSDAEAFGILNEATQTVTDQEAYDAVKDIFEEIAIKQLIRKADLFLEQDVIVNTQGGKRKLGYLTGKPVAAGRTQVTTYGDNKTTAYPNDQIEQVGPNETQQRQLAQRPDTAQRMRGLRSANQELTKANQEGAARIAELEAKIQEMEAAEANMNQQQKAQSDAIQDQLAAMIKQIQNTNTAANQNVINIGGGYGAPQSAPTTPQSTSTPSASSGQSVSTPAASNTQSTPSGQSTSPKPGILSKIGSGIKKLGSGIKKALPTLGTIGGAALGSALGPGGTMLGGALGRGLGRFLSPTDPKASFGQRLKDAGKSALAGGAMGLGGQIGAEMLGNALGGGTGDMSMPADNASSALMNPGEVPSEPGPYADSNPSQPYTPGAGDSGFQNDTVNSTGMPNDVAQASNNPYGAEAGTGLPTDSGETQEGDDEPAKRKYRSVDNTKGATRLMRGR